MLYNTITLRMNATHYYYMQGPSQTWPFQGKVLLLYYEIGDLCMNFVTFAKNSSTLLIINSQFSCFLQYVYIMIIWKFLSVKKWTSLSFSKCIFLGGFHFSSSYYFTRQIFNMNLEFFFTKNAQIRMNGDTTLNS